MFFILHSLIVLIHRSIHIFIATIAATPAPTSGLGPGAVLGIVMASVALLLGAAGLVVWQRTKQAANADADGSDKVALRDADGEADRSYPTRSAHGAV